MDKCNCMHELVWRFAENPDSCTWDELAKLLRAGYIRRNLFGFGYRLTAAGENALRPKPTRWISRHA